MPRKDIEDIDKLNIGHNEETFEFFTNLAKIHKENMRKQDELMKDVKSIEKIDITEVHKIVAKAHGTIKQWRK